MSNKLNTDHWRLKITVDFIPIKAQYEYVPCSCSGPFHLGRDYCDKCRGEGKTYEKVKYPPKPEVPKELLDMLKDAYGDYLEKNKIDP